MSSALGRKEDGMLHFVVVPKLVDEPFFDSAAKGCSARAQELGNVVCHYIGYPVADALEQAAVIRRLTEDPRPYLNISRVDGLAVAVLEAEITGSAIDKAVAAGIPVITFDSDAPASKRSAHISTDNYAFGQELGKVLDQLRPSGGGYGIITGLGPNLVDRVRGLRDRLEDSNWVEVGDSPKDCENNITLSLKQMHDFASHPSTNAVIPVGGWPMFDPDPSRWKEFVKANRHVTTVVADSVDIQLELMNQGFVDGLVGQLPYQMGEMAADTLLGIIYKGILPETKIVGSHLLEILRHPLILPAASVDKNHVGDLAILGYILFGVIASQSLFFLYWTYKNQMARVVRVSQPLFMAMICMGSLLLASSLIPLAFDDEFHSARENDIACMSIPWLITLGFATAFSALSSKTWRVVKILHNAQRFERIEVAARDVVLPYLVLMIVNVIVLLCWTLMAPLKYVRQAHLGTDDWNRVISTYGQCQSSSESSRGGAVPFFVVLSVVNIGLLIVANVQAYRARSIHTEFSESRYVAIVMASMLQTFLVGLPMLFLVYDQPEAFFIVLCVLVFVTCMAIQLFMFVPKILVLRDWKARRRMTNNEASVVTTDERMKAIHMGSSVLLPHLNQRSRPVAAKGIPMDDDDLRPDGEVHQLDVGMEMSIVHQGSESRYSIPYERSRVASRKDTNPGARYYGAGVTYESKIDSGCMVESLRISEDNPEYLSNPDEWATFFASMMKDVPADRKLALVRRFELELNLNRSGSWDHEDPPTRMEKLHCIDAAPAEEERKDSVDGSLDNFVPLVDHPYLASKSSS
jgi:ABC-type sugar transport system substrate-binding protein